MQAITVRPQVLHLAQRKFFPNQNFRLIRQQVNCRIVIFMYTCMTAVIPLTWLKITLYKS